MEASFDEERQALINQIRVETKAELEAASIKALHLSPETAALLHRAGFRTIHHLLHPTPEQQSQVRDIHNETRQEIRDRLLWAYQQSKRHSRRQIAVALRDLKANLAPKPVDDGSRETSQNLVPQAPVSLAPRLPGDGRSVIPRAPLQTDHVNADTGWAGMPGSRLYEWELKLRAQFKQVAWIGQIVLSEADFNDLCQAIQLGAQKRPSRVPAAVFITTLVFAARYAQQNADEFWQPYLRAVWNQSYSQTSMLRCRERFRAVVPYLQNTYGFVFPRQRKGDLVAPIYRHALLPRYVHDDLARWLQEQWQEIMLLADAPDLLITELRESRTLDYLPQRLQTFLRHKDTEATAVAIIRNMAAAISLYVKEGETIEAISELLAGVPIEQELWREIAQIFADTEQIHSSSARRTKARLTWVWSLFDDEMALRVQNIILPADSDLAGEPDRLVWLESANDDPLRATIEVAVAPWRMNTGEREINDVFIAEPDGPLTGQVLLLTDMDEIAVRLAVPPFPTARVQFFRLFQRDAYGIPVEPAQVTDGEWLVCATQPLTLLDETGEEMEPDATLAVPYPLKSHYQWAARLTLQLPVKLLMGTAVWGELNRESATLRVGRPLLLGANQIVGLSSALPPTFADRQITFVLAHPEPQLLKEASLWLRGQSDWKKQLTLAELLADGIAERIGTDLHIHLSQIIPEKADLYQLELRASLQPLLPSPLQFAVVPGLAVESPPTDQLYTPANPPRVILSGIDESVLIRREGVQVDQLPDGRLAVVWHDLRHEPSLTLNFDRINISLAWALPHFMAWVEPKPARPFLTMTEFQDAVLHAVGTKTAVTEFRLFIPGQRYRSFPLGNGRYATPIGQSQLYDMVKLAEEQPVRVQVQVGEQTWQLLEVRHQPELTAVHLEYDPRERVIHFDTGLQTAWEGNGRFLAESLTNPFVPPVELKQISSLEPVCQLPAHTLLQDAYLLRLELDGVPLPLDQNTMHFTIGPPVRLRAQTGPLVQDIRSGQLIPTLQAEDFILLWAENAEQGMTDLTATTLYQLATIPTTALENFDFPHLRKLWRPLEQLKAVANQSQWITDNGYLPAWIVLDQPVILHLFKQETPLNVYPIKTGRGGREGYGYGVWPISSAKNAPKKTVLVQWHDVINMHAYVQIGVIPDKKNVNWMTIQLTDTYPLYRCVRCGQMEIVEAPILSQTLRQSHFHGPPTKENAANLRNITHPQTNHDRLKAKLILNRQRASLATMYAIHEVRVNSAATYLPEPIIKTPYPVNAARHKQLSLILREIKRLGTASDALPYWASAFCLLDDWQKKQSVSLFGQMAFALGALLRAAARHPKPYHRLLNEAALSEKDVQELLQNLNNQSPEHVQWGLTWAELLMQHSSRLGN
jgi:hypothetical protein